MTDFTRNNRKQPLQIWLAWWLALSLTLMASVAGAMQMQCLDGTPCPYGSMAQTVVTPTVNRVSSAMPCPACGTRFTEQQGVTFGTQIAAQSRCLLRVNPATSVTVPQKTALAVPVAILTETPRTLYFTPTFDPVSFVETRVIPPPEPVRLHSGRAPPRLLCA